MAKCIMIQGTMSNVGKSLVVAGLCRIFARRGYNVAPFKSQNMALNSFVTGEGLEIGRAQAMQAQAAGIEPSVLMNPILLKPNSDTGSQVVLMGEAIGNSTALEYFKNRRSYMPKILEAYNELSKDRDIIIIEGAGSPAEINLRADDIVNMGLARELDAPVLIVGDIDPGGVFAQLVGTLELLSEDERSRVKGLLINKFRGDIKLLKPGLDELYRICQKEVLGVIPYMELDIEAEDSLAGNFGREYSGGFYDDKKINIAVVKHKHISNFTDFQALKMMENVNLYFTDGLHNIKSFAEMPDALILPGTKNTIEDLQDHKESGLSDYIREFAKRGGVVIGICGGFQMLGEEIVDEEGVETCANNLSKGLELLPVRTILKKDKKLRRVRGRAVPDNKTTKVSYLYGKEVYGYEIHSGVTEVINGRKNSDYDAGSFAELEKEDGEKYQDGFCDGNVIGTYIHGIFDSDEFREALIRALCEKKGIAYEPGNSASYEAHRYRQYDILADGIEENIDMSRVCEIIGC